jgi:hypothetical protein
MRTLQEWLGHRDFATTLVYADYAPSDQEREWSKQRLPGLDHVTPDAGYGSRRTKAR